MAVIISIFTVFTVIPFRLKLNLRCANLTRCYFRPNGRVPIFRRWKYELLSRDLCLSQCVVSFVLSWEGLEVLLRIVDRKVFSWLQG